MTDADALQAAASLFNAFAWDKLLPLVSVVIGMLLFYWMLAKAQKADPTFQAIHFLYDENMKPSWKRLIGTGCFVMHSWIIYMGRVKGDLTFNDIALYVLAWSGSVILLEALRLLRGAPTQQAQPDVNRGAAQ